MTSTDEQVSLSLSQMVDLAIGVPEVCAVNFNILHTLLHVLAKQLDPYNLEIQFRGDDGLKVKQMLECKPPKKVGTQILSQYDIIEDGVNLTAPPPGPLATPIYGAGGKILIPAGAIIGPDGKLVTGNGITVGPDGKITDANGKFIGYAGPNGTVLSADGKVLGAPPKRGQIQPGPLADPILGPNGEVLIPAGAIIGPDGKLVTGNGITVGPDGKITDANGKFIGYAGPNGSVLSADGKVLGAPSKRGKIQPGPLDGPILGPNSEILIPTGAVIGPDGKLITGNGITVGPDGKITDANGKFIGYAGPNGTILSADGKVLGTPTKQLDAPILGADGKVLVPAGALIGSDGKLVTGNGITVDADGKITDANGKFIGYAGSNGTIVSANGQVLGTLSPERRGKVQRGPLAAPILGADGKVLIPAGAIIGSDGKLVSGNGITVGPDGKITDANGKVIGYAGPNGSILSAEGKLLGSGAPPLGRTSQVLVVPPSRLEKRVAKLEDTMDELLKMANNDTILAAASEPQSPIKPTVNNAFNLTSLNKRVEAAEEGIKKVSSVVDDIAKKGVRRPVDGDRNRAGGSKAKLAGSVPRAGSLISRPGSHLSGTSGGPFTAIGTPTTGAASPEAGGKKRLSHPTGEAAYTRGPDGVLVDADGKPVPLDSEGRPIPTTGAPTSASGFIPGGRGKDKHKTGAEDAESEDFEGIIDDERFYEVFDRINDLTDRVNNIQIKVDDFTGVGIDEDAVSAPLLDPHSGKPVIDETTGKPKVKKVPTRPWQTPSFMEMKNDYESMKNDLQKIKKACCKQLLHTRSEEDRKKDLLGISGSPEESIGSQIIPDEMTCREVQEHMQSLESKFGDDIELMRRQISDLQKEFSELTDKINTACKNLGDLEDHQDYGPDVGGLPEVYEKLRNLQMELENLNATTNELQECKTDRQSKLDSMLEAIEFLKTVKADREDLEDALADKADQQAVNRKVSHDQFDATCDEITRSLEDALCKLTIQEDIWKQALDNLTSEIGNKLDKTDVQPLRDFVNTKLKSLQERLKALATLKKETEAAGTKSKLLRDVQCISCDKDVVMRRDVAHGAIPGICPLPPNRSMRPYLTYELDALRKQTKKLPFGRNLIDYEVAVREETNGRCVERTHEPLKSTDHLCNRYCGGSHTLTTAHQRVTHLGHFLQQWGPEAIPIIEGFSRGTDGKMYKIREDPRPMSGIEKKQESGNSTERKSARFNELSKTSSKTSPGNENSNGIAKKSSALSAKVTSEINIKPVGGRASSQKGSLNTSRSVSMKNGLH